MAAVMDLQTTTPDLIPTTYIGRTIPVKRNPPTMGTLWSQANSRSVLPPTHEASQTAAVARLFGQLHDYRSLEDDWDGYGGIPATYGSFISAIEFVQSLGKRFSLPKPMLAGDGEISLFWEKNKRYLEISFPGDGTYHYIYKDPDSQFASPDFPLNAKSISSNFNKYLEQV